MKDYTNNAPAFSEIIQITETSDPAHADIINKAPIQIFQNTLHNRKTIEKLKSSAGNAEVYNTETEYQKGNYCTYNDAMYKCIQPTQGEWDPTCWEEINLLSEISDLQIPEFDDSGTAAGITSFPTFLQKVKSKMNIFEFYRNFKAGMQYVLHAGQIVNNCASDAADLPLAAAQGKALWDQITRLNSEINDTIIRDLASKIDSNFISTDYTPSFFIVRIANTVMASVFADVKNLTGRDTIMPAGSIPTDFVPPWSVNLAIQGRSEPTWATASYYPCTLSIKEDGSVDLVTGANKDKVMFIAGDMLYLKKITHTPL